MSATKLSRTVTVSVYLFADGSTRVVQRPFGAFILHADLIAVRDINVEVTEGDGLISTESPITSQGPA